MDYEKLRSEIGTDPEALGYSEKTDVEITDLMNIENRTQFIDVNKDTILKYLIRKGRWLAIFDSTQDAARNVIALLNTTSFDVNGPEPTVLIDALVTLRLLGSDDKTYIQSLGQKQISRAQELSLGNIRVGQAERVRI